MFLGLTQAWLFETPLSSTFLFENWDGLLLLLDRLGMRVKWGGADAPGRVARAGPSPGRGGLGPAL